ncbi:MAG TPA: electron transfer flavoprotein subunit beta/FixA family protein [Chitinophagaceae bacterium]|nr:electron transfer flavoprotein subunit beta/FixA family protein [Chitinophagaceae bacterium]HPH30651.1 electron transfer flavoprotein subunit beta/FixA family protein [Chitinophagaceae bacterium]HPN57987.1 electron transfer flavoprotein subunit beta/FixA family protein [Chitinophagaceae bacterium]
MYKIIVLAKQVPDTRNVGKDAMKADGTVNRAALPAIFNPEDLNALELALEIKDQYPDTKITLLTMGPVRAAEILREGMYRGADAGVLLTDKAFAGSDTLATSYALSCAIRKIGEADLILAGRQAIDGDTAQVGPQVADKLGIPQITYAEEIISLHDRTIQVKRRLERGVEVVECTLPVLITAHSTAPECRPRNAKRLMRFKRATTLSERHTTAEDYLAVHNDQAVLITEWCAKDVNSDLVQLGLGGSPTKVRQVENIVFQAKESKVISTDDGEIESLMQELISQHTIG